MGAQISQNMMSIIKCQRCSPIQEEEGDHDEQRSFAPVSSLSLLPTLNMSPISKQQTSEVQYSPLNFIATPNKRIVGAAGGTTEHLHSPGKNSENFDTLFRHHLTDMKVSQSLILAPRHSVKSSNALSSLVNSSFNKISQEGGAPQLNRSGLKGLKKSLKDLDRFIEEGKVLNTKTTGQPKIDINQSPSNYSPI